MRTTPKQPGPHVEEVPSAVRTITGVATSIAAFLGWAPQGPTDHPALVLSWVDFQRQFGGLDSRSLLGYSVNQFFLNGGRQAYIVRLAGGDGTVLTPNTAGFETALQASGGTGGVNLLAKVDLFNLLCVPGETNSRILGELDTFCSKNRAFLIADSDSTISNYSALSSGPGFHGDNSALYFPWLYAPDPLAGNVTHPYPPCGFVAGVYASTDARHGVWKAPAGTETTLAGLSGVAVALTDQQNGVLNAVAVNSIRTFSPHGTLVWGARTTGGSDQAGSQWKYVPVRRLGLFLENSVYRGTRWAAFEPNDDALWSQIRLNVGAFMQTLFRQGAFQGSTPQQAYFVKCDGETTTATDQENGIVNILVGFAPLKPAEFIVLQIRQTAGRTQP